jgi:hypothetical protein
MGFNSAFKGLNKLTYVRFAVFKALTEILTPEDGGSRFLKNVEFIPEFTLQRAVIFKPRDAR